MTASVTLLCSLAFSACAADADMSQADVGDAGPFVDAQPQDATFPCLGSPALRFLSNARPENNAQRLSYAAAGDGALMAWMSFDDLASVQPTRHLGFLSDLSSDAFTPVDVATALGSDITTLELLDDGGVPILVFDQDNPTGHVVFSWTRFRATTGLGDVVSEDFGVPPDVQLLTLRACRRGPAMVALVSRNAEVGTALVRWDGDSPVLSDVVFPTEQIFGSPTAGPLLPLPDVASCAVDGDDTYAIIQRAGYHPYVLAHWTLTSMDGEPVQMGTRNAAQALMTHDLLGPIAYISDYPSSETEENTLRAFRVDQNVASEVASFGTGLVGPRVQLSAASSLPLDAASSWVLYSAFAGNDSYLGGVTFSNNAFGSPAFFSDIGCSAGDAYVSNGSAYMLGLCSAPGVPTRFGVFTVCSDITQ